MRIARIGNLNLPVPALEYGGIQRSMAQMTAFQAALHAHHITIYAPSDSSIIDFTGEVAGHLGLMSSIGKNKNSISIHNSDGRTGSVTLKSANLPSMGEDPENRNHALLQKQLISDNAKNPFDIIHCHHPWHMTELTSAGLASKTIVHAHTEKLPASYLEMRYPLICISQSQAQNLRQNYDADVRAVIHHGLDSYTFHATAEHAGYLAWIGRFLKEKGAHRAIKIAKAARKPLIVAGGIYEQKKESRPYYERAVKPLIDQAFDRGSRHIDLNTDGAINTAIELERLLTPLQNPALSLRIITPRPGHTANRKRHVA